MKIRIFSLLAILLVILAAPASAQRQYILRAAPEAVTGIAHSHGLTILDSFTPAHSHLAILLVRNDSGAPHNELLRSVRSDPSVINFELNDAAVLPELNQSTVAILDGLTTDRTMATYYGANVWSQYLQQPAVGIIRLFDAQQTYATGAGIIAIIDTGVDPTHPVLAGSLVKGYDFTRNLSGYGSELLDISSTVQDALAQSSPLLTDKQAVVLNQSTVAILDQSTVAILDGNLPPTFGHGTMVAGLVHLAAPNAKIMPLKAFSGDGTASLYNIVHAVYFAVDNGARAINMSFSMSQPSNELATALSYANANRTVAVASVGNSGINTIVYPAAWTTVLGTASTSNTDQRSTFSNYGSMVEVAAPGEQLITIYPGSNWAAVWGTSFSGALVSGGTGLLRQISSSMSQSELQTALSQAVYVGPDMGAGRIDLYQACGYLATNK